MGFLKNLIDRAAKEVQKETGETDRREWVSKIKSAFMSFKENLSLKLNVLNKEISAFNEKISLLNTKRKSNILCSIKVLHDFLINFGTCKRINDYAEESQKAIAELPKRDMERIENYIREVDWSKEEVYWNTLLSYNVVNKTRKQNLSLQDHYNQNNLEYNETLRSLDMQVKTAKQDTSICDMYLENIELIARVIEKRILPELELVEAFFQAQKIKDEIICNHKIDQPKFSYQLNSLIGTPYEKHYRFVKNAFLFYVLSCKIYDTPVLTNLINRKTSEEDRLRLEKEMQLLISQERAASAEMMIHRGGDVA